MPVGLPTQLVHFPVVGGLNEAVNAWVLDAPTTWLTVDNWVYSQNGLLHKRQGYEAMPATLVGSGTLASAARLDTLSGQLLCYANDATTGLPHIYSWSTAADAWVDKDNVCPASIERAQLQRGPIGSGGAHVSSVGGYIVVTYVIPGTSVMYKVLDAATGAVVVDETQLVAMAFSALRSVSFACGGFVVLLYQDLTTNNLKIRKFNPTTLAWSAAITVAPLTDPYDACTVDDDAGIIAIAWGTFAAPNITVQTWDVNTLTVTGSSTVGSNHPAAIAVACDGTYIAVAAHVQSTGPSEDVTALLWDTSLTSLWAALVHSGSTSVDRVSVGFDAAGHIAVLWDGIYSIPNGYRAVLRKVSTAGALLGSEQFIPDAHLYSRPFLMGGALYAVIRGYSLMYLDESPSGFQPWLLCGAIAPGEDSDFALDGYLPRPLVDGTTVTLPLGVKTDANERSGVFNVASGIDLAMLDFDRTQPRLWGTATVNDCLVTTGGITCWFDGQSCVEYGFFFEPKLITSTVNAGAGSIEGAGSPGYLYTYAAYYEWIDEKGNTHRSRSSSLMNVAVDAAHNLASIDVAISYTALTRKGDVISIEPDFDGQSREARVVIYRSLKDAPELLYRLTAPGTAPGSPLLNNRLAQDFTYTDTLSDAQVSALGYGVLVPQDAGGPLDNDFAPASTAVAVHKGRVWLVSADDNRAVWFSKRIVRGEAPGFNFQQQVRLDDAPDGITAIASLDDKLVIFTASRIYYVIGDGPADTGTNGAFSDPFLVTASAGCVDARSVVTFDGGIAFQSKGGLYLLNRGLQIEFIGVNVQTTLRTHNEVLSAAHDPDRSWLVWLCKGTFTRPTETGTETIARTLFIVFDYLRKAWFTWSMGTSDPTGGITGQVFWNGAHAWCDASTVDLENFGTPGLDPGGAWITSSLETPWLKVASMGGRQRVKHVLLTCERNTGHVVHAYLSNDFNDDILQSQAWDATSGGPVVIEGSSERLDLHVKYQKCSAIKVRLFDSFSGDYEATDPSGFSIAGLTMRVGVEQGQAKVPAPNRR